MKALIFAAGVGKRLFPYTQYSPKCLIDIGGTTLLERMLMCLNEIGVKEVNIVVGHLKEKVIEKLDGSFHGISIQCIQNDRYREGSILSLWAARDILKEDDFLIMDADVLFPVQALERLVRSKHENCFLMDDSFKDTSEEMKLGSDEGRVLEIGRKMSKTYDKVGEGVGFLKVSKAGLPTLRQKMDEFYQAGLNSSEYEELLDEWLKEVQAGYELVSDLPWTEMDFYEDLKRAWLHVLPSIQALDETKKVKPFNRRLSGLLIQYFLKTNLTPNHITLLSFLTGLVGLFFFSLGGYFTGLLGALFFQLCCVLDNCDGEVARARGLFSKFGHWLDISCDGIIHVLLFPAIGLGRYIKTGNVSFYIYGLIAAVGIVITFLIYSTKRILKSKSSQFIYLVSGRRKSGRSIFRFLRTADFSVLVLLIVLLNGMNSFLWISAIGIHVYWILTLVLNFKEAPVG